MIGDSVFINLKEDLSKEYLNEVYLKTQHRFRSKAQFLKECLMIGAQQLALIEFENFSDKVFPLDKQLYINNQKYLNDKLEDLYSFLRVQIKHVFAKQGLIIALCSALNNMKALAIEKKRAFPNHLEAGFYDNMPRRFNKLYKELLRQYGLLDDEASES